MTAAPSTTTFAQQRAFAAEVAKEEAAVEWAVEQSIERQPPCRRVRQRRTTRDGREIFNVTFFDGDKPKRGDWLAGDAKRLAEFQIGGLPERGSLEFRLRQLKRGAMSKSRSEPCLGSAKRRERRRQHAERFASKMEPKPFRTLFPLPAKGIDLRKEAARSQADLLQPRPETVALSATEKHEMRRWGVDVDVLTWPDGTTPPRWVKAVGHTTSKWANREMAITAAREKQEFLESVRTPSRFRTKAPSVTRQDNRRGQHHLLSTPPAYSWPPPSPAEAKPPVPWAKELRPVREGRRQLASGEIISFLDQHVYPEGGVAEVKRARRREKEAFLRTVFLRRGGGNPNALAADGGNVVPAGGRGRGSDAGACAAGSALDGRAQPGCPAAGSGSGGGGGDGARAPGREKHCCRSPVRASFDGDDAIVAHNNQRSRFVEALHVVAAGGATRDGSSATTPATVARTLPLAAGDVVPTDLDRCRERGLRDTCLRSKVEQNTASAVAEHPKNGACCVVERPGPAQEKLRRDEHDQEAGGAAGRMGGSGGVRGGREEQRRAESDGKNRGFDWGEDGLGDQLQDGRGVHDGQEIGGPAGLDTASAAGTSGNGGSSARKKSRRLSASKGIGGRVATPSPVVTSSVSVLDMGVLRPS